MTRNEKKNWEKIKLKLRESEVEGLKESDFLELYKALLSNPQRGSNMQGKRIFDALVS